MLFLRKQKPGQRKGKRKRAKLRLSFLFDDFRLLFLDRTPLHYLE